MMLLRSCCCWHMFWSWSFCIRWWRICYWLFCCCSGPSVVIIPSAPCVTTDVGVPSDFGVPSDVSVPAVTDVLSFFSIHAVVWHSTVDTNGKLATAVVVGKFATGINDTDGQWKHPGRCDRRCRWSLFRNVPSFIIRGLGEDDLWKNLKQKSRDTVPLNFWF